MAQFNAGLDDEPTSAEIAAIAERGGSFDWLADEPDLYSPDDGEPVWASAHGVDATRADRPR